MVGSEIFGKVVEANVTFFEASANSLADAASAIAAPPAPEPEIGGFNFDGINDAVFLLAYPVEPLGFANRALRTHARVAISPIVASLAKLLLSWSPHKLLIKAAKQKRLLLEHWRKRSGFGDLLSDEEWLQEILMPIVFQLGEQADLSKPPPQTFKPSPSWLTPSSPRSQRAPTCAA